MSTLKMLIAAALTAAALNQIIPPFAPETSGANCDTVTECAPVEID